MMHQAFPTNFYPGMEATAADLKKWNEALRQSTNAIMKSGGAVGYPQQGVEYSDELAPMVAQSIQPTVDSATFTDEDIVISRLLPTMDVWNPLHEATIVNRYGDMHLDGFSAEGATGPRSRSNLTRKTVQIKYQTEHRALTFQAANTRMLGGEQNGPTMVSSSGLNAETSHGLKTIIGRKERHIFWADSDVSPLQFDGLYKQITSGAPNNVRDKAGAAVLPQELVDICNQVGAAPNHGRITHIFCDPRYYSVLSAVAQAHGRFQMPMASVDGAASLQYGIEGLTIVTSKGRVKIVEVPMMLPEQEPAGAAVGDAPPTFTVSNIVSVAAASHSSSLFKSADAADYRFKIEAVGDKGVAAVYTHSSAISVGAGDRVKFDFDDAAAATSGKNSIRYYNVYRSDPDGAAGTCRFMWRFARNTAGASSGTLFYDVNAHRPNTAPLFFISLKREVIYWLKFLDAMRIPLPMDELTLPFELINFGTPFLKIPKHCFVVDNAALSL
jgi:hypothetical protein